MLSPRPRITDQLYLRNHDIGLPFSVRSDRSCRNDALCTLDWLAPWFCVSSLGLVSAVLPPLHSADAPSSAARPRRRNRPLLRPTPSMCPSSARTCRRRRARCMLPGPRRLYPSPTRPCQPVLRPSAGRTRSLRARQQKARAVQLSPRPPLGEPSFSSVRRPSPPLRHGSDQHRQATCRLWPPWAPG